MPSYWEEDSRHENLGTRSPNLLNWMIFHWVQHKLMLTDNVTSGRRSLFRSYDGGLVNDFPLHSVYLLAGLLSVINYLILGNTFLFYIVLQKWQSRRLFLCLDLRLTLPLLSGHFFWAPLFPPPLKFCHQFLCSCYLLNWLTSCSARPIEIKGFINGRHWMYQGNGHFVSLRMLNSVYWKQMADF